MSELKVYNSYSRQKEVFTPITPGHVGMYVCGPTVSGESHLGHARPYITFDIVYRYLAYLGYKVRYVRNITDAGHFEEEGREAEDKISKKAVLEKLEPMELVQKYTNLFHWAMEQFNTIPPSIEPTATGHIVEQIGMIQQIIKAGYAYEVNGSVYFDVKKYAASHDYGKLSGRVMDDLLETTRELEGQEEKRDRADFALWKNASPEHIMRWQSPWGIGYPGWHIECSAMATKYLGTQFDIHGGGMDLLFPHHESEIAQSTICNHMAPVRYWIHNNMITINGRKMGKSYNNVIKLTELFSGNHSELKQAYHPMVIRFFILQSHYRGTLDFSNEALKAAERGLKNLFKSYNNLKKIDWQKLNSDNVDIFFDFKVNHAINILKNYAKNEKIQNFPFSSDNEVLSVGFKKLIKNANRFLKTLSIKPLKQLDIDKMSLIDKYIYINCWACKINMDDDFNTAKVLANISNLIPLINSLYDGNFSNKQISYKAIELMKITLQKFIDDIFGLKDIDEADNDKFFKVIDIIINLRKEAKDRKDFVTSDKIRNRLNELGILVKDEKDGGMSYSFE